MPLCVVRSLHPYPELGRATVVVPGFKMGEINRLIERLVGQQVIRFKIGHDGVALLDEAVDRFGSRIGPGVEVADECRVMTFPADPLHAGLVVLPGGTSLADGREQVPGQPVTDVVCRTLITEAAEVAGRAGRCGKVLYRERSRLG